MKHPITSTLVIVTTTVALASSSYFLNRYCAVLPVTKVACKLLCTAPQITTMRLVFRKHEILAFIVGRKLGYI